MPPIRRRLVAAGAGLCAAALALLTAVPSHAAAVSYVSTSDPVKAAAGWLGTQFVNDTHLPAPNGDHFDQKYGRTYYPNQGVNADVVFGLAAAKAGADKIDVALGYLADHVDAYSDITNSDSYGPYDGSVAKLAVAALVAGHDATDFGGYDLLRTLATDECPTAATTCTPGSGANIFSSIQEAFVILAEARAGGAHAPTAQALTYFTSLQCASGGFTDKTAACGTGAADTDATSYAIMALHAAGGHPTEVARATAWLAGQRNAGGYWVSQGIPNANSTGLAAAALQGENVDVSAARTWLRSQQQPAGAAGAGAIRYDDKLTPTTTSGASPSVLATAQGLTGLVDGGSLATVSALGASAAVPLFAPHASVAAATVHAGTRQTASGSGFVAGEQVVVSVHSTPATVGRATANAAGAVTVAYTLPATLTAGRHSVVLTGQTSGLAASRSITVPATGSTTSGGSTADATSTPGDSSSSAPLADTGQNRSTIDQLSLFGALAIVVGLLLTAAGRRQLAAGRHRRR